jgi:hypothetical protein
MKQLFAVDAEKSKHTIAHDDGEGGLILETKQDITQIIEINKQKFNDITSLDRWGDLTHIATIPDTVIDDLNKMGIMRGYAVMDEPAFAAFLNNPDNRYLRVRPGRL